MIEIYKAQPLRSDRPDEHPVADLHIVATKPFPDIKDHDEALGTHDTDARFVVSALLASLPGGTVDAVLRLLLEHRASLLRVRWPK